jgi:hypothetical protein
VEKFNPGSFYKNFGGVKNFESVAPPMREWVSRVTRTTPIFLFGLGVITDICRHVEDSFINDSHHTQDRGDGDHYIRIDITKDIGADGPFLLRCTIALAHHRVPKIVPR